METLQLPVFDLAGFLALPEGQELPPVLQQQCCKLAECLRCTGCLLVRAQGHDSLLHDACA